MIAGSECHLHGLGDKKGFSVPQGQLRIAIYTDYG